MEFSAIWILSIIILLITFLGIVFISKFLTKPFDDIKFSFMRVFPFEVGKHLETANNFYRTIVYLFGVMCFTPIFVLISDNSLDPFLILLTCIFGLAGICFIFIHIFDVTHVKVHLLLFTLFLSLVLIGNAMVCFNGIILYKGLLDHSKNFIFLLICSGFAGIFAVVCLLIAFNPKLKTWARLDKIEGEEDKYSRPLKFPLAYSEWAIFLLLFLGEVVFFLELTVK